MYLCLFILKVFIFYVTIEKQNTQSSVYLSYTLVADKLINDIVNHFSLMSVASIIESKNYKAYLFWSKIP